MYETSKFSERLKELIDEKEITPQALAAAIDYGQVYSWLSSLYMPSFIYLIKLADYFKCSVDFLIGLSDDDSTVTLKQCPPFSEHFPLAVKTVTVTFTVYQRKQKSTGAQCTIGWKVNTSPPSKI